jgi:hypothetical protein
VNESSAKSLPELRIEGGVYVAVWSDPSVSRPPELLIGDVIHRMNGNPVESIEDLTRADSVR